MLLMLEILQTWRYFKNYHRDPPLLRYAVGFLMLNSIECMIGNFTYVYMVGAICFRCQLCRLTFLFLAVLRHILGYVVSLSCRCHRFSSCCIAFFPLIHLASLLCLGDSAAVALQYWPTPNFIVSGAVTALTVQTFLVWRFFALFVPSSIKDALVINFIRNRSKSWIGVVILWGFSVTSVRAAKHTTTLTSENYTLSSAGLWHWQSC